MKTQLTISIDGVLAERLREHVRENGKTISGTVCELVESALRLEESMFSKTEPLSAPPLGDLITQMQEEN